MGSRRRPREQQCAKCPWKVKTDPHQIPDGYSVEKHRKLKRTIAEPGSCRFGSGGHVMACHESKPGEETYCLGWLANQLGPGNNIGLRLQMMDYDLSRLKLNGKQHQRFEDTLPCRQRRTVKSTPKGSK